MSVNPLPFRLGCTIVLIGGLALVAGCSSSSDTKSSGAAKRTTTTSSANTSSSTVSSSTTAAPASAPCTVAALTAVLPSGTRAIGVVCTGGWAAGPDTNGNFDAAYLAQASGATWRVLSASEMQQACATGNSLGIPENVLAQSPCKVS